MEAGDARGNDPGDLGDRQIALGRKEPLAAGMRPFPCFIELADHAGTHVVAPVVQMLLQLVLDHLTLLLDHQDLFEPVGELPDRIGFERPRHRDLEDSHADARRSFGVDAELLERFENVAVRLARRHDAESRVRRINGHVVQLVFARIRNHGVNLVVLHQGFLLADLHVERVRREPGVDTAFGKDEVLKQQRLNVERVSVDGPGGLDRVGQGLEPHGQPCKTRHRECMQSELDVFLDALRVKIGNHGGRKDVLALIRKGR